MALMHIEIKSGKPGKAADHAQYILREGSHRKGIKAKDIVARGHGNLPVGIQDPLTFWKAADKGERVNGAAYREIVIALPCELTPAQRRGLVEEFIDREVREKPYEFALHCPNAALGEGEQPHAHVMFSDRIPDGILRKPECFFHRYNARHPEKGGCRKDSGGKDPVTFRQEVVRQRESWASLLNEYLVKYGHESKVDARSNRDRGIAREPERHLGPARIRALTVAEKDEIQQARSA
ncbi:MAG: MobA/MobL family protein [Polaromonas sp.]|uniref:MobA/MobL family protein n=1 Tax=Polaromonas sp. TaxID=1869339 RepID=UPI002489724C|nr:MobA/MobL family protein [Polaromonas sp.]MDI1269462.1 MobA/MobL family protein [Polaromonas sp.]